MELCGKEKRIDCDGEPIKAGQAAGSQLFRGPTVGDWGLPSFGFHACAFVATPHPHPHTPLAGAPMHATLMPCGFCLCKSYRVPQNRFPHHHQVSSIHQIIAPSSRPLTAPPSSTRPASCGRWWCRSRCRCCCRCRRPSRCGPEDISPLPQTRTTRPPASPPRRPPAAHGWESQRPPAAQSAGTAWSRRAAA
jgi:hypothetical protein